jgi:hypothetical protein
MTSRSANGLDGTPSSWAQLDDEPNSVVHTGLIRRSGQDTRAELKNANSATCYDLFVGSGFCGSQGSFRSGPLEYSKLMPERENFGSELELRAGRGAKRGQQGDEQRSHAARERYHSVGRCNGHNRYGIFSRDSGSPQPPMVEQGNGACGWTGARWASMAFFRLKVESLDKQVMRVSGLACSTRPVASLYIPSRLTIRRPAS